MLTKVFAQGFQDRARHVPQRALSYLSQSLMPALLLMQDVYGSIQQAYRAIAQALSVNSGVVGLYR